MSAPNRYRGRFLNLRVHELRHAYSAKTINHHYSPASPGKEARSFALRRRAIVRPSSVSGGVLSTRALAMPNAAAPIRARPRSRRRHDRRPSLALLTRTACPSCETRVQGYEQARVARRLGCGTKGVLLAESICHLTAGMLTLQQVPCNELLPEEPLNSGPA
ncbi:hypothetical protein OH77DRAFT_995450 [Trametes cingulata]|nr:hypothetical protein OH77DRAFT_995450 [Trametes cingulata]